MSALRESLFLTNYRKFLLQQRISPVTVDNYIVDSIKFLDWLAAYLTAQGCNIRRNHPTTYIAYANQKAVLDFIRSLLKNNISRATAKRRLAGLRKFLDFATATGYLINNPMAKISTETALGAPTPQAMLAQFKQWLAKQQATDTTIKNYLSDLRHFLAYAPNLDAPAIQKYIENTIYRFSSASVKRKFSALRKFAKYLRQKQIGSAEIIVNHLQTTKAPQKSRREPSPPAPPAPPASNANIFIGAFIFLAVNIFFLGKLNANITNRFTALQQKLHLPTAQSSTTKITVKIPLAATLKDNFGIPLSYQQEINFAIYPGPDSSNLLYSTGRCPLTPDANGRIQTVLGEDCGRPIPYALFVNYPELYLGVSLGFGGELQPRTALKRYQLEYIKPTQTPTSIPAKISPLFIEQEATNSSFSASSSAMID